MNIGKLKNVTEQSKEIFKNIKQKYVDLSGDLVFSSLYGQSDLTDDINEILKLFPNMIVDSQQKERAFELTQILVSLEMDKKKTGEIKANEAKNIEKAKSDLAHIVNNLQLKEDTFIEIRFDLKNKFNLDSVFHLQKDELVSQKHTPQTKASIRIVLGTIGEIYKNNGN